MIVKKGLGFICVFMFVVQFTTAVAFAATEIYGEGKGIKVTSEETELFKEMFVPPSLVIPKRELLRVVLQQKLFAKEAVKEGLDQEPKLRLKLKLMRERELATAYVTRHLFKELGITDDVLKSYYLSHIEDYTSPDKYKVAQIVLKTKEDAEKVRQLIDKGSDFGELVKKYSLDYLTWKSGGVLGSYPLKGMNGQFATALKGMKKGDVSGVIASKNGFFYIVKLIDIEPGKVTAFKDVEEKIKPIVVNEKKLKVKKKMAEKLLQGYDFTWKPNVLTDEPVSTTGEEK